VGLVCIGRRPSVFQGKKIISIVMYLALFFASDMVLLMCNFVSRMLTAGKLGSSG